MILADKDKEEMDTIIREEVLSESEGIEVTSHALHTIQLQGPGTIFRWYLHCFSAARLVPSCSTFIPACADKSKLYTKTAGCFSNYHYNLAESTITDWDPLPAMLY